MVRPKELVESVLHILQNNAGLPDETNFVGYEPDIDSESIKLPLIEVSLAEQAEINEVNTDFVGFRTDNDGNQIGRIYESLYTQTINISIWTAHGSKFSPREIDTTVREALYDYATTGPDKTLPHPEMGSLDEVWRVKITEGSHTDDLGTSPTLRRWEEVVEISASEKYITDSSEPPIEEITQRLEYDDSNSGFEETYTV